MSEPIFVPSGDWRWSGSVPTVVPGSWGTLSGEAGWSWWSYDDSSVELYGEVAPISTPVGILVALAVADHCERHGLVLA